MKKTTILILLSLIICSTRLFSQDIFENKEYGFSIQTPSKWITAKNKELLKNLDKFELTEESLTKFVNDHKGSILLASFYKYDPKTHAGLIPTIQVNVRVNPAKNFEEFKSVMVQSSKALKNYFPDFEFDIKPKIIEISGINTVYFVGKFSMQTQDGVIMKVRSRTYAIPYGSYFFQVNFTDGQEKEDCSKIFDELSKSIKIGR